MKAKKRILQMSALLFALCSMLALAPQQRVFARDLEIPISTVVKLTLDANLTSREARVGDPFTATVFEDVRNGSEIVIPRGAKVKGRVATVTPAQRESRSGSL
jgi:hypothetical protein